MTLSWSISVEVPSDNSARAIMRRAFWIVFEETKNYILTMPIDSCLINLCWRMLKLHWANPKVFWSLHYYSRLTQKCHSDWSDKRHSSNTLKENNPSVIFVDNPNFWKEKKNSLSLSQNVIFGKIPVFKAQRNTKEGKHIFWK